MTELNCINNQLASDLNAEQLRKKHFDFEASYLGVIDYNKSILIQLALGKLAKSRNQISVLGLQHPAVITLGHRADESTELILNRNAANIPTVRSSRGGLATVHSEGQLVIYPILNLKFFKLGVRDYVYLLLLATQDLLKAYGISAKIDLNGAGVYTEAGKISFCGIQVHEGITSHGISLNVRNDLSLFQLIRSCGVQDLKLDSLSHYQVSDTADEVFQKWSVCFQNNLSAKCKVRH